MSYDSYKAVAKAVRILELERKTAMAELMRDFDSNYYYPNLREIQGECSKLGHKWSFSHLGPLNEPWYYCKVCFTKNVRDHD